MALEDAETQVDTALKTGDPRGLSFENVFSGVPSFLRRQLRMDAQDAQLAILGLPFDQAVTNRPGARFGPRAIRDASLLMAGDPPFGWDYDVLSSCSIVDCGDVAYDYGVPEDFANHAQRRVSEILGAGAAPLILGGDHSATLPVLRACAKFHGPLAIIQIDAHTDTWPVSEKERMCHGTFLARAVREGLIDTSRSILVGIRTQCPDSCGIKVITAPECHAITPNGLAERIRARVGVGPAYLSFDIDGLDPAFAPGTGTPVMGGLVPQQALGVLRALAGIPFVGADVMEVCPPFDTSGITALAGAQIGLELLGLLGWSRGGPGTLPQQTT
jgi:agmatinase